MRKNVIALVAALGLAFAVATPAKAWYGGWGYGGWGYGGAAIGAMAGAALLGGVVGGALAQPYYGGYGGYYSGYYYPQPVYVAPPRRVIRQRVAPVIIEEDYYGW